MSAAYSFRRGLRASIEKAPIIDGSIVFSTDTNDLEIDVGNKRHSIQSATSKAIIAPSGQLYNYTYFNRMNSQISSLEREMSSLSSDIQHFESEMTWRFRDLENSLTDTIYNEISSATDDINYLRSTAALKNGPNTFSGSNTFTSSLTARGPVTITGKMDVQSVADFTAKVTVPDLPSDIGVGDQSRPVNYKSLQSILKETASVYVQAEEPALIKGGLWINPEQGFYYCDGSVWKTVPVNWT